MQREEMDVFGGTPRVEDDFNDLLCSTIGYSLNEGDTSLANSILRSTPIELSKSARVVGSDRKAIREASADDPEGRDYPDCVIQDPEQDLLVLIECKWRDRFRTSDHYHDLQGKVPESEVELVFIADFFVEQYEDAYQIPFREVYKHMKETDTNSPAKKREIISKLEKFESVGDIRLPTSKEVSGDFLEHLHELIFEKVDDSVEYDLAFEHKGSKIDRKRTYIKLEDETRLDHNSRPRVNILISVPGRKYGGKRVNQPTFVVVPRRVDEEDGPPDHILLTEEDDLDSVSEAIQSQMDEIVATVSKHLEEIY